MSARTLPGADPGFGHGWSGMGGRRPQGPSSQSKPVDPVLWCGILEGMDGTRPNPTCGAGKHGFALQRLTCQIVKAWGGGAGCLPPLTGPSIRPSYRRGVITWLKTAEELIV